MFSIPYFFNKLPHYKSMILTVATGLVISWTCSGSVLANELAVRTEGSFAFVEIASEQISPPIGNFSTPPEQIEQSKKQLEAEQAAPKVTLPRKEVLKIASADWLTITGADTANDLAFYCKATMAALFGRPISIMKEYGRKTGISYIEYVRPNDRKRWRNRCKFLDGQIIWGGEEMNGPGTSPGRWRTHSRDEKIILQTNGQQLKVTIRGYLGSVTTETYSVQ